MKVLVSALSVFFIMAVMAVFPLSSFAGHCHADRHWKAHCNPGLHRGWHKKHACSHQARLAGWGPGYYPAYPNPYGYNPHYGSPQIGQVWGSILGSAGVTVAQPIVRSY